MLLSSDGGLCVCRLELTVHSNGLEEGDLKSAINLMNQNSSKIKSLKISSCMVAHYLDGCEVTNFVFSAIPNHGLQLDLSRAQNLKWLELMCLHSGKIDHHRRGAVMVRKTLIPRPGQNMLW